MLKEKIAPTNTAELFYEAWQRIRKKSGVAGVDGESLICFEKNLFYNILKISEQFEQGTYSLSPLNCVYIPKRDSGLRCVGIPTIRDRIVLNAVNAYLMLLWDDHFSKYSFGYRPNKNCADAINTLRDHIENGQLWYIRGDIRGCFDSLDWSILSAILKRALPDESLRTFVNKSFRVPFIYKGISFKKTKGVPQGSPISPVLANLYLHQFDMEMANRGIDVIRYCDDWVCMTRDLEKAKMVFKTAKEILGDMRIKINPFKSRIGCLETEDLYFLGYKINSCEINQKPWKSKAGNF